MHQPYPPFLKFLGTGGGRHVMALQTRSTAGFLIGYRQTIIHVDPGPGALVHLRRARPPIHPLKISALILSHRHIDHSSDASALIEAITDSGKFREKQVFLPHDALEPHSVLYPHVLSHFEGPPHILEADAQWTVGDIQFRVSRPHIHPVETYGFHFFLDGLHCVYISDTAYIDDLISEYRGADIAIVNVTLTRRLKGVQHLTLTEALELCLNIQPKVAFFTHFGPQMVRLRPWKHAQIWSAQAGCRIIPAHDGLYFDLQSVMETCLE